MLVISLIAKFILIVLFGTWTTPRTWVAGELVTASMMNVHVRDNINSVRSEHFNVQQFRGLHLRTSPDANIEATTVVLLSADEIVADDATRFTDVSNAVSNLVAIISTAGVNGLDTGSEAASTWYEIYFIAKDDGTKALLLHRAKDYFQDETSTAGEDGQHLLRDAAARTRLAQGFKVDTAGKLEFVDVKIARIGSPTGEIYLTIQNDAAGVPGTTIHATSDKMNVANVSTTSSLIRFVFHTPFTTVAATQYHLVMNGTFAVSAVNHVLWRADTTAGAYANGSKAEANNGTWTADADDDFIFKVFVTRNDTAVTMPTGYTKKAKVGYVFNDSSSNFALFIAHDRFVQLNVPTLGSVVSSNLPVLSDLSAIVPPVPVTVSAFAIGATITDSATLSPVPDGYALSVANRFGRGIGTGADRFVWPEVSTEMQGLYVFSSGTVTVDIQGYRW